MYRPLLLFCSALILFCGDSFARAQDVPARYQDVLTTLGKTGDFKGNVLRVNIPRSDLSVTVDGRPLPTSFGFGGWLAMTGGDKGNDVMMGDLVLLEEEVNPVMSAVLDSGLEVTALHNHFFFEKPRIFYMHVHGVGKPADLARKAKPAVDLIGRVQRKTAAVESEKSRVDTRVIPGPQIGFTEQNNAAAPQRPAEGALDTAALDRIVGHTGASLAGGTYKYTIGRDDLKLKEMGALIDSRMGLNTWASFHGNDADAVVAGDVAMLEHEVTPVLKALRAHNIDVVAIHHHMTGTKPVIIFLHYWGKGRTETLARGFRAALDELGKGKRRMTGH
jgi:hypothetical protein